MGLMYLKYIVYYVFEIYCKTVKPFLAFMECVNK